MAKETLSDYERMLFQLKIAIALFCVLSAIGCWVTLLVVTSPVSFDEVVGSDTVASVEKAYVEGGTLTEEDALELTERKLARVFSIKRAKPVCNISFVGSDDEKLFEMQLYEGGIASVNGTLYRFCD